MTAWQPIETAPRDGTHILAILVLPPSKVRSGYNSYIYEVWWSEYAKKGKSVLFEGQYFSGWQPWPFEANPTHWMPLPPPPEVTP